MSKKYFLKTFGCAANVADSERIRQALKLQGYRETKKISQATVVVINSCVVRQSAENRVYGLLNQIRKSSPVKKIILTGCLAGWALRDKSGKNLSKLRKRIGSQVQVVLTEELADFNLAAVRSDKIHAYVPISWGCSHFCTYCIVPYARGPQQSRRPEEILREIKKLVHQGYRQITLLGENVNAYQYGFPSLLEKIAQIPGLQQIDFLSPNPWDFSDQLVKVIRRYPHISRTIHLPLQSGDDEILKKMNRPYTARQYLALVKKIKKAIPQAEFTTDIIVGFPGETKKHFANTVKLCRKIGFKKAYLARYSPRPGTAAEKMVDDVPPQEKKRRWQILEKLINSPKKQDEGKKI